MLFQTPEFLVLLLVVLTTIALLPKARAQHWMLLIASCVFYGWWDVRFLLLLLMSTLVDYSVARGVAGERLDMRTRVRLGLIGLTGSLFCLGVNWPLLQTGAGEWSWSALWSPSWQGLGPALALSGLFSVVAPLAYDVYFLLPERRRRQAFLATSITVNLGMLGFFKYCDFFLESGAGAARLLGWSWRPEPLGILLPVGISFYTFQTMSYTIDAYRGAIRPERSLLRVLLYVSYFPQLVAGPIMRPQEFFPTLDTPWALRAERLTSGFHLALVGLFKKLLIADSVAVLADAILDDPIGRPSAAIMLGSLLFAVQIYCDFSGYTDIARGVSRMLGVEIAPNFQAPYFSTSIIEFWRRWHISLSTWLRDYLYIPLGGSRGGRARTHFNLLATMVLGGLWHGAAWNFVVWGAYQGTLLCVNRELRTWIEARPRLRDWLGTRGGTALRWTATMYFTLLGWLIFRVGDPAALAWSVRAFLMPVGGLSLAGAGLGNGLAAISLVALAMFIASQVAAALRPRWEERLDAAPQPTLAALYALAGLALFLAWPGHEAPFVYFQF